MKNGEIGSKVSDKHHRRNGVILGRGYLNQDSNVPFEFITLFQNAIYKSMKFINGKMIGDTEKFHYVCKGMILKVYIIIMWMSD